MGFDASGTFTRSAGVGSSGSTVWQDDATAGIKIIDTRHDSHDQDLANGLSACLLRNGAGVPTANIPWGGFKITGLANPTGPQDVATKYYVDNPAAALTARNIDGADLNGRLNFRAPSGVNGITWTYADLSWVARGATVGEANNRLVLSATVAPDTIGPAAGLADVFVIDEAGHINTSAGRLTHNVSYDGATLRTISPGTGTVLAFANGNFGIASNDVATITNNYAAFTPRTFFAVNGAGGSTIAQLDKSASGKTSRLYGSLASKARWIMDLGNAVAESGVERVGSDFGLYSYSNDGLTAFTEMSINRLTHKVTFGGELVTSNLTTTDAVMTVGPATAGSSFAMQRPITSGSFLIYGGTSGATGAYLQLFGETHTANARDIILGTENSYRYFYDYSAGRHYWANNTPAAVMDLTLAGDLSISGQLNFDSILQSTDTTTILATTAGGTLSFRCNGAASATEQIHIDASGSLILQSAAAAATGGIWAGKGVMGKSAQAGAYGAYFHNFNWNGSVLTAYANASIIGNLSYSVSDYRIKKDITPLGSMWNAIKALKPIRYTQQAYDVWVDDDTPRLGFLAHELQEGIGAGAVLGEKDGPDVQFVNPMAVIAVLTKALQEAIARIEALEAV